MTKKILLAVLNVCISGPCLGDSHGQAIMSPPIVSVVLFAATWHS